MCGKGVCDRVVHKLKFCGGRTWKEGANFTKEPTSCECAKLHSYGHKGFRACCIGVGRHRQERSPFPCLRSRGLRFSFTLVRFSWLRSMDKIKRHLGKPKQQKPSLTWLK